MTVLGNGVKCVCCNLGIESTNVIDGQKVSWSMPLKIIFQVTRLDCPNVGRRKGRQLVVVAMAPYGHSQKQLSFKSRIGKKVFVWANLIFFFYEMLLSAKAALMMSLFRWNFVSPVSSSSSFFLFLFFINLPINEPERFEPLSTFLIPSTVTRNFRTSGETISSTKLSRFGLEGERWELWGCCCCRCCCCWCWCNNTWLCVVAIVEADTAACKAELNKLSASSCDDDVWKKLPVGDVRKPVWWCCCCWWWWCGCCCCDGKKIVWFDVKISKPVVAVGTRMLPPNVVGLETFWVERR